VYYIEFIRKRDDVSWERFSEVIGRAYRHWAELHPEDAPVLAIGRTSRARATRRAVQPRLGLPRRS